MEKLVASAKDFSRASSCSNLIKRLARTFPLERTSDKWLNQLPCSVRRPFHALKLSASHQLVPRKLSWDPPGLTAVRISGACEGAPLSLRLRCCFGVCCASSAASGFSCVHEGSPVLHTVASKRKHHADPEASNDLD